MSAEEAPRQPAVRVGCCGWSYKEWVGPFYRTAGRMLTQYSRAFDTVEMDSSFYRVPEERTVRRIAAMTPPGFRFTVKLPGAITHEERSRDSPRTRQVLGAFARSVAPLRERGLLSLVLVQLPPSATVEGIGGLEWLLGELRDLGLRTATEFRHPSWLADKNVGEALRVLRGTGSSYTVVDEPLLPPIIHRTAEPVYMRLHGRNPEHWYDYDYGGAELEEWAGRVRGLLRDGNEVIVVFNNHPHGYAPKNALTFRDLVGASRPRSLKAFET